MSQRATFNGRSNSKPKTVKVTESYGVGASAIVYLFIYFI